MSVTMEADFFLELSVTYVQRIAFKSKLGEPQIFQQGGKRNNVIDYVTIVNS